MMKQNSDISVRTATETDRRCCCGQLLARLTRQGVELKCKRCKRIHLVPWEP